MDILLLLIVVIVIAIVIWLCRCKLKCGSHQPPDNTGLYNLDTRPDSGGIINTIKMYLNPRIA